VAFDYLKQLNNLAWKRIACFYHKILA